MAIPLDPWQVARDRYLDDINDEEKALFSDASSTSLETFFYSASAPQKLHQSESKVRALAGKLKTLTDAIEEYGKAIDVFANASSLILCPIWGSIRVVLHIASEFGKYFEKLIEMFERIGDVIPRFRVYERLFSHHVPLLQSLSMAYFDIINFCGHVKAIFKKAKKNSVLHPIKLLWRSFSGEFDVMLEKFRTHRKSVEKDAGLAHMIEASESRKQQQQNLELEHQRRKEDARLRLLTQLSTVNSKAQLGRLERRRQAGTCEWLSSCPGFKEWHAEPNSSVLWCHGIPGCGKSILSTKVIDILTVKKSKETVIAYFYCDYANVETLNAATVLGTLARQLLEPVDIPAVVEQDPCLTFGATPLSAQEASRILEMAILPHSEVYLVVDGLHECPKEEHHEVLRALRKCCLCANVSVKIFLSSREPTDYSDEIVPSHSIQVTEETSSSDLCAYVHELIFTLPQIERLTAQGENLKSDITKTLCEKARGMFLWVAFQIEELCEAASAADVREMLESLPRDLAETYERILLRIQRSKAGERKIVTSQRTFMWIICAQRPLHMSELKEAVALSPDDKTWDGSKISVDEKQLLQACGNLVVYDRHDDTVRLAHYTAQQYILSSLERLGKGNFQFSLEEAKDLVGDLCVAYLSFSDFETQVSANVRVENLVTHTWATSKPLAFVGDSKKLALFSWPLTLFGRNQVALPEINLMTYATSLAKPSSGLQNKYMLLKYCIENWTYHTKHFSAAKTSLRKPFSHLVLEKQRPFEFRPWSCRYVSRTYPYLSLFTWALEFGHLPLLEILAEPPKGPSIDQYVDFQAKSGPDPLEVAARLGYTNLITFFTDPQGVCNRTPLRYDNAVVAAAERGDSELLRILVEAAARSATGAGASIRALTNNRKELDECLKTLLISQQYIAHINDTDALGRTSLYYAAKRGYTKAGQALLSHGAYVNGPWLDGQTGQVLPIAAQEGHLEFVRMLLKFGAEVDRQDEEGFTALHWAARTGNRSLVLMLFEQGCDINKLDRNLRTALHWAVMSQHYLLITLLNTLGVNVHTMDSWGRIAREYFHATVGLVADKSIATSDLLDRSIVSWKAPHDNLNRQILWAAVERGEEDVVRILLDQKGIDISLADLVDSMGTLLFWAIAQGRLTMVELLLSRGADVNSPSLPEVGGNTPVHAAISTRDGDILRLLLKRDPNLSIANFRGILPMGLAASMDNEEASRLMTRKVMQEPVYAKSALHISVKDGDLGAVRLYMKEWRENGMSRFFQDKLGTSVVHTAVYYRQVECLKLLLELGADPHCRDWLGDTPLHLAAARNQSAEAQILLASHPYLEVKNNNGETALEVASKNGSLYTRALIDADTQKRAYSQPFRRR